MTWDWWKRPLKDAGFSITPAGGLALNEPKRRISFHPVADFDDLRVIAVEIRREEGLTAYYAYVLWDGSQYTGYLQVHDGGGRATGHTILTGKAIYPQDVFGGIHDTARRWCEGS